MIIVACCMTEGSHAPSDALSSLAITADVSLWPTGVKEWQGQTSTSSLSHDGSSALLMYSVCISATLHAADCPDTFCLAVLLTAHWWGWHIINFFATWVILLLCPIRLIRTTWLQEPLSKDG